MHPENKPNYSKFSGEIRISVFNLFSVAQPKRFGKKTGDGQDSRTHKY